MIQFFDMSDPADRCFVTEYLDVPADGCLFAVSWGDKAWPDQVDLFDDLRRTTRTYVRSGCVYIALS